MYMCADIPLGSYSTSLVMSRIPQATDSILSAAHKSLPELDHILHASEAWYYRVNILLDMIFLAVLTRA